MPAATVANVVRDALLHLGVVDARQPIKAVDMADGIRALNLMLRAWEVEGLSMGFAEVDSPSAELPFPAELEEMVGYNLAIRLQSRFRIALDDTIVGMAREGKALLSAQVTSQTFVRTDLSDLPAGVGAGLGDGLLNGLAG